MALRLGDEAPNFTAETTEGTINFHEWLGNGWGVDFRAARLEGASINAAKVSGAYFPVELSASEIELSLLHGTRMRYQSKP